MNKPILCLDFDGVLHSYASGWQGAAIIPDPPVPGAIAFLYEAIQYFNVQIYSSRSHQSGGVDAMMDWIALLEDRFWQENTGAARPKTSLLLNITFPMEKPSAFVTIDDRALTFTGTWPSMEALQAFKPWNKRSAPPYVLVPLEDLRAAELCELAAARLRREDARLDTLTIAERAAIEVIAGTAIDAERECRIPRK